MDIQLQLLIKGDHAAFEDVFRQNYSKVFRYLLKRVTVVETAQELAQQCFVRVWQYHSSLSPDYPIDQQLFVIARSLLLNYLKQEERRDALKETIQLKAVSDSENTTAGRTDEKDFESRNFLNESMKKLPDDERDIIRLKYIDGYTNKEISERLLLPLKTVEGRVSRAYKRLGTIIQSI